jgi:hypothetical protein
MAVRHRVRFSAVISGSLSLINGAQFFLDRSGMRQGAACEA